ncbi:MAG: DUF2298 domain-containing protein [Chloroflexota bacterium]
MGKRSSEWIVHICLLLVLIVGGYLRLAGLNWDEAVYLHPDERFLMMVESSLEPVKSLGEYFDTANSTLNPHNRGHPFFVYGTFPIFLVRYLAEWLDKADYGQIHLVGRPISALVDLGMVLLVYLIARRLYNRWVGLLAAAFLAFSVLDIQLSHFFKEDTFMAFFALLTVYFAVRVATDERPSDGSSQLSKQLRGLFGNFTLLYVLFGVALGMAVASKVNAAPVAFVLLLAEWIRASKTSPEEQRRTFPAALVHLVLAAITALVTFRVLQPYAFSGPGFWGIKLNPQWIGNLQELKRLASADSVYTFPPSLQWANRPMWFAWINMVRWGLGMPLGLLAWCGFLFAGWRMLRGEWRQHAILWSWTAVYFVWQSSIFNPMMRYQLPVYPTLAIFAAWVVARFAWGGKGQLFRRSVAIVVGVSVLVSTFAWAWAFSRIYTRSVTRIEASRWIFANIPGAINLQLVTTEGQVNQPVAFPYDYTITPDLPYTRGITPQVDAVLEGMYLPHVVDKEAIPEQKTLQFTVSTRLDGGPIGEAHVKSDFLVNDDQLGQGYWLPLDSPVALSQDQSYYLNLALVEGDGALALSGASIANESSWDDGLPLRIDGYDGFGGIYQNGLTFELYWEDNSDKLARFINILDHAEYLIISSSRQWGSITRLPGHYPLTWAYYQHLMGCPQGHTLEWCYNIAQVGSFEGDLGFDLIKVFQSDPNLGSWRINDQFAEESFTVYDHPKVFIFRKSSDYDPEAVAAILGSVDLSSVRASATEEASKVVLKSLMLPEGRLVEQREGGTWAELFPSDWIINLYPALGAIFWYVSVLILGLLAYPIIRLALSGLADRGYPLARIAGLLMFAYPVWLGGSLGVPATRLTILGVFLGFMLVSGILAYCQREALRQEWRERKKYFLMVEALMLAFFLFDLFIRLGNSDLWHPYKGGEKPMDFSYLNAVMKSTTFPPYDPWYAGGYINYYYYGFVLVGVWIKLLGISPTVVYNLVIPSIFSLMAMGAFSIGWNLVFPKNKDAASQAMRWAKPWKGMTFFVGIAAGLGLAVLGNLGVVRMIFHGLQQLGSPTGSLEGGGVLIRWFWAARGFFETLSGAKLPYRADEWYWNPSRVIPPQGDVEPITEFPFFTVLYADLHAHLIAIPVALLAIAWALSFVFGRAWKREGQSRRSIGQIAWGFMFGGLIIGALYPINLSDIYSYLPLGMVAVAYTLWWYRNEDRDIQVGQNPTDLSERLIRVVKLVLVILLGMAVLAGLAILLYQPYAYWYAQGYRTVDFWKGPRTPSGAYLTHWGLFLFVIVGWIIWETRQWLASTPLSALSRIRPYFGLIQIGVVLLVVSVAGLMYYGVHIAWLVVPLIVWVGVLLLRSGLSDTKRVLLFFVGLGLTLTLMVEVIVVSGDIGRMNTVFKFYLQAWVLFSVSAAVALGLVWRDLKYWLPGWRLFWQLALAFLVAGAALFPFVGTIAKVQDRMASEAPHTLDGMAYMQYATYFDLNKELDLSQDYRAIRWMQDQVKGSPVIVEANSLNLYHWFSRFTIYTGLPGVVGWDWHQRQQRGPASPEKVTERVTQINEFYLTGDIGTAVKFLREYDVQYIIVGQLERAAYPGPGLEKFTAWDGIYWQSVYRDGDTVIYEVMKQP